MQGCHQPCLYFVLQVTQSSLGAQGKLNPNAASHYVWPGDFTWRLCWLLLRRAPALLQDKPAQLMGVAATAADGQVLLEALEAGTAGVVLRTEDAGKLVRCRLAHCCDDGCQSLICCAI